MERRTIDSETVATKPPETVKVRHTPGQYDPYTYANVETESQAYTAYLQKRNRGKKCERR